MLLTMNGHAMTLSSKGQVTFPAEVLRKKGFKKGRRFFMVEKGNSFVITPEPTLQEQMQPFWDKAAKHLAGKKPLTNEELSRAARDIWASGEVEFR